MFTELKTHQENQINKCSRTKPANLMQNTEMIDESQEESYYGEKRSQEQGDNVEDICAMVHHLLSKNVHW